MISFRGPQTAKSGLRPLTEKKIATSWPIYTTAEPRA